MAIWSNQHLALANRQSGQEPLYVHTSQLGMPRLQATKGSAISGSRPPGSDPVPQRSQLASHSRFPLPAPHPPPPGGSLRMTSREIREPPEEEPRAGVTGTREKRVRNLGRDVSGACTRCPLRLLPQGSDRSARRFLKLIPTNFRRRLPARSCRPAAPCSGVGRATSSGRARDPG